MSVKQKTKSETRGRKKIAPELRNIAYGISLGPNDIEFIERESKALGVNTSKFIRALIESYKEQSAIDVTNKAV